MAHLSLYRKWRPQSFDDVVGQEPVTRTLRSAIASGRVAHAYLFSGHRGTGKTTTARILAKALNCERGPTPDPCNACEACRAIADGFSMDVIELDAASNRGIDEIREIRERVRLAPASGRYKVYILDEAHMLTTEAENALLKTLEEPPPHVVFVLVTTEPHRLPATILSRCQRFEFRRIPTAQVVERLRRIAEREGLSVSPGALHRIARAADGALRDAESVLDQLAASVAGPISEADVVRLLGLLEDEVVDALTEAVRTQDAATALRVASDLVEGGRDVRAVLRRLLGHFRDLLVLRVAQDPRGLVDAPEDRYPHLAEQARGFAPEALLRALSLLSAAEGEARWSAHPRLALELALLRLARPDLDPGLEGLRARVERLEQRLKTPQSPPRPEPAPPAPQPTSLGVDPPVSLEQAAARWPRVLEEVKAKRAYTFALLAEGQPAAVEAGRLVVRFPPGSEFALRTLEDPRHRGLVEHAVRAVLGSELRVQFVAPDGPASPPAAPRDPLVEQATHLLGPAVAFRPLDPEERS
ncbi:DNA polymerase III subunit gamma/tau [bacterium HR32]|jgi:DNA polymerase-3 subunit gamma/tau|nr:DNA polymerase III subunit gamma/tau [bacterium HR32]